MQLLYQWSGLGRPLTIRLLSHRLLMLCAGGALLVATGLFSFYAYPDVLEALSFGIKMGLAVFLSWALARELHPDAPWAAFFAITLSSAALFFWPWPDLSLLFFLLMCLRLINRTSGVAAKPADIVLLLAFTAWLLWQGQAVAGIMATAAFWYNARLPEPQTSHKYLALLVGLDTLLVMAYHPSLALPRTLSIPINIFIIALSTGFALFSRGVKEVSSVADADGQALSLQRVKSGQLVTLLVIAVCSLWYGDVFFTRLSPLWAGFGGIFLYTAIFRSNPKDIDKHNDSTST